jgi:transcriptional regulator with XRE-family HTH domain
MAKRPDAVDVYVGQRVRMRRLQMGISQEVLGKRLNLTFQQVQKYEKGSNRVSASRLQQISNILNVPVAWFFKDAPGSSGGDNGGPHNAAFTRFIAEQGGQKLMECWVKLTTVERSAVVGLAQNLVSARK